MTAPEDPTETRSDDATPTGDAAEQEDDFVMGGDDDLLAGQLPPDDTA